MRKKSKFIRDHKTGSHVTITKYCCATDLSYNIANVIH